MDGVKEDTNILRTVKRKRADCIDHIFSRDVNSLCQNFSTDCFLKTLLKERQKERYKGRKDEKENISSHL
jgi:hypothetical protein